MVSTCNSCPRKSECPGNDPECPRPGHPPKDLGNDPVCLTCPWASKCHHKDTPEHCSIVKGTLFTTLL